MWRSSSCSALGTEALRQGPGLGRLEGCGQQEASREEGPNKMEVVDEALAVRSS